MNFTPIDLAIAAVFAVRRFGLARATLVGIMLLPAYLWALPPNPCGGCFPPLLRRCTYGSGYVAAMKSDLKNLASQQEIYFSDHGSYSFDPQELAFTHSDGVTVTIFLSPDGWAAVATHAALGEEEGCRIYYGTSPVYGAGLVGPGEPGQIVCSR